LPYDFFMSRYKDAYLQETKAREGGREGGRERGREAGGDCGK